MSDSLNFKTIVVGDSRVGKTAFVERHFRGLFPREHEATVGSRVYPISILSTLGPMTFSCWDIAGREELGGFRGAYYAAVEALMIFYDVTSRESFMNIPKWFSDVSNYAECDDDGGVGEEGGVPVVLVGTKLDEGFEAEEPSYRSFGHNDQTEGSNEGNEEGLATSTPPKKAHVREVDYNKQLEEGFESFGPSVAAFFAKYSKQIHHVEISSFNNQNLNGPFLALARTLFNQPSLALIDAPSI